MDFSLSSQQKILIETVQRFIATELSPLEDRVEREGVLDADDATAVFEKSRALGLYAMNIPARYGGGDLSTLDWMLVEEQFGRTTDILIRRAFGNVYEILLEANVEQQQRWLLPTVRGERTCSIAFTEPEAGSDAAAIKTRAVADGDDWILNGYKHYISDAHHSDFFVVTAVTDAQQGHAGISTFIVDKGTAGFEVGPNQPMMGLRGTSHAELFMQDVRLPSTHLLGEPGGGLKLALTTLGRVRLAQVCARAIGRASHVLDLAIAHSRERQQFGRPIGEFQMIGKMLADSAIEINAARLSLWQAALLMDQGDSARTQISAAKVQAAEVLGRVVDRAVQIFGGSGYASALPIERYYRDARIYRIFDGTSEIHRNVLSRRLLSGDTSFYSVLG